VAATSFGSDFRTSCLAGTRKSEYSRGLLLPNPNPGNSSWEGKACILLLDIMAWVYH